MNKPKKKRKTRGYSEKCEIFVYQTVEGIRDAQESRGLGDVYKRQRLRPRQTKDLSIREEWGEYVHSEKRRKGK